MKLLTAEKPQIQQPLVAAEKYVHSQAECISPGKEKSTTLWCSQLQSDLLSYMDKLQGRFWLSLKYLKVHMIKTSTDSIGPCFKACLTLEIKLLRGCWCPKALHISQRLGGCHFPWLAHCCHCPPLLEVTAQLCGCTRLSNDRQLM